MTKIYYDTEFFERGNIYPIQFISIGMTYKDLDGARQSLYLVSDAFDTDNVKRHPWLSQNVWRNLPLNDEGTDLNLDDPCVLNPGAIAKEIRDFISSAPKPSLWSYFSSYDHVVVAQLFGRMVDLPGVIPQRTNDLAQEAERLGYPPLPVQSTTQHHALADALWHEQIGEYLWGVEHGESWNGTFKEG